MIRAALVDDQAIVRAGLARILSPEDGFEVVAECADGQEAVAKLPALQPDIVLMDVRMPALDGIAATRHLRSLAEPLEVLVLTTFGEDGSTRRSRRACSTATDGSWLLPLATRHGSTC